MDGEPNGYSEPVVTFGVFISVISALLDALKVPPGALQENLRELEEELKGSPGDVYTRMMISSVAASLDIIAGNAADAERRAKLGERGFLDG